MTVTALLVSNDGARWLPAVLAGLAGQRHRPDRVIAVDSGSSDATPTLLAEALGADAVLSHPGSFPAAVAHALPRIDTDWVWLLHDDLNPDPGALEALLSAAEQHDADVLGPKLREWPSLRRLLELGVTISGTGSRETGLERGEYDQGQHDEVREVLAVNTAGMLVRREVLEHLDGFEQALPLFGNDIDFGWRAARAGYRTVVVPDALAFHAEAAHRGLRRTALMGRRTRSHRAEREAALFTLLANLPGRRLPLLAARLAVGSVLRMLGYLLARSPGLAGDEFAALLGTAGRIGRIRSARRARRALDEGRPGDVRRLLAPWWVPYRHGLDLLTDLAVAAGNERRAAAERRRLARIAEGGPEAEEADALAPDTGLVARYLTSPVALGVTVFLVLTLWGARDALGAVTGGALSPPPAGGASDWWALIASGWHELGQGTDAPEPAYLLPLALLGTLLGGSAAAAVSLVLLGAVPFAAWGAWRFGRVAAELGSGHAASPWLVGWAALAYAAVPVASGAWGQGRLGVVVSAALLPWLAHAALGFAAPGADRRWRAGWRVGLLLTVLTAFTPAAWPFTALVVLIGLLVGLGVARDAVRSRSVWGPPVTAVLVPAVLLLPGVVGVLAHDLGAVFLEAGRPAPQPGPLDLLAGRLGDPSAPIWLGLLVLLPALAALARRRARLAVVAAWVLVAVAAVLAALLSRVEVALPAGPARPGLGFLMVVAQAALLVAVLVAAHGLVTRITWAELGWRQGGLVLLVVAAVVGPLGGWAWWVTGGGNQLADPPPSDVPAYMAQAGDAEPTNGVLVLRGETATGLTWQVRRDDGVTLGEDEILALTRPDPVLDATVGALLSRPTPEVVARLADFGIAYLVLPPPYDGQVAATLDAASGLVQASAPDRDTRAWQVAEPVAPDALAGTGPWWHPWLLGLQGAALVVVAVLCGPARREEEA